MVKTAIQRIVNIFLQIPLETWEHIVACEPEWRYMSDLLPSYREGPFAVLMVAAGLNDFQLKGKAEKAYWPVLKNTWCSLPSLAVQKTLFQRSRLFTPKSDCPN
ncbi:hypothetical protein ABUL39_05025 [Rhodothermus marinus]|uniref:hypothetical protein n=1 Tax=Rhodothermus marinus TaxID=29549 RepID=UPI0037C86243